jgi:hypothetical protein
MRSSSPNVDTSCESRDAHAVDYAVANQPLTAWRFNAEAYSRIDPHIAVA